MDKKSFKQQLPIPKAVLFIFLSLLMVSGTISMIGFYVVHYQKERMKDPHYRLVGIVQTTPQSEMLKTDYIAELLQLNIEAPISLYEIDKEEARIALEKCPLIRKANVKHIPPGTLHVDYELREPIAYLGDYTNTAIDREGALIPFHPFFTPKNLPVIYVVGMKEAEWGKPLPCEKMLLAFEILDRVGELSAAVIESIDVSRAFAKSMGKREVIVTLRKRDPLEGAGVDGGWIIRFSMEHLASALDDFNRLCDYLDMQINERKQSGDREKKIIDMRIPGLAYIQE